MNSESEAVEIRPSSGWRSLDLRELWRYRELLYFLVWRDLKLRFKQTVLGVLWLALRPLITMALFTVVFSRMARMPSEGAPYPVFVLIGMIPWNFFSAAVSSGAASLVGSAPLITKVYFPRLIVPAAATVSGIAEVFVSFLMALGLMAWYGQTPPLVAIAYVPLLFIVCYTTAFGVSLFLGALNVRFRDIGNAVPFLLQLWMYATPVVYPLQLVPQRFRWLVELNPMSGVVEGFRSALLGSPWNVRALGLSVALGVGCLVAGALFFKFDERSFADNV